MAKAYADFDFGKFNGIINSGFSGFNQNDQGFMSEWDQMSGEMRYYPSMPIERVGSYYVKDNNGVGMWATPFTLSNGQAGFRVTRDVDGSGPNNVFGGGGSGKYNGSAFDEYDAAGNHVGSGTWGGLGLDSFINNIGTAVGLGGAAVVGGALGAWGAGGGAGGAADAAAMYGVEPGIGAGGAAAAAGAGGAGAGAGAGAAGAGAGGAAGAAGAGSGLMNILKGGGWTSLIGPALSLIGGAYANHQADNAADAQIAALNGGIDESRRQFDTVRELLRPYVDAGTGALSSYQALSGASGPAAQQAAIDALKAGPQFGSLVNAGEEAILQNASATGGLRGGNVQGALADKRTEILSGLIDKQLGRYGGLIQVGQSSAAGTGTAALNTGQQVSNLMGQQGAAEAGGILAGTRAINNALGGVGGFAMGYGTPGYGTGVIPANQPARAF